MAPEESSTSSSSPLLEPRTKSPALPPLNTSNPLRRTGSNKPTSIAQRRISQYSAHSRKERSESRPISQIFPSFHSSLPYCTVRDFAYLASNPLHYGPQADASGIETPASERSRRLSDPAIAGWEDSRSQWSATASWYSDGPAVASSRERLPAMTFNDGGPPYSEDEDLRSPIITSSRHRKKGSNMGERGRSPGAAGIDRGRLIENNHGDLEEYRPSGSDELNGPGGEIETYAKSGRHPQHRDSNFAKPIQRDRLRSPYNYREQVEETQMEEDEYDEEDSRLSKDYSFTIASPDEEMHGKAVALFDFTPEHENELGLREGQIILVSYRHGQGWLVAEDPHTKESGLVPEEFVRLVRHIEGGLNGLQDMDVDESDTEMHDTVQPVTSPEEAIDMPPPIREFGEAGGHTPRASTSGEKHPAVQSTFSTSSRDFSPLKTNATSSIDRD